MNKKVWTSVIVVIIAIIVLSAVLIKSPKNSNPIAASDATTHYFCEEGTIDAVFSKDKVDLALSDGRSITLSQAVSGSGIRYEKDSIVFIGKGDDAFLTENDKTTFSNCVAGTVTDDVDDATPVKDSASATGGNVSVTAGTSTFVSNSANVTFMYPKGFTVSSSGVGYNSDWRINTTETGKLLVKITSPKDYAPTKKTNLSNVTFTVGTSSDKNAIANCLAVENGETRVGIVTIGGVDFTKTVFGDAGAGNLYNTTSYRAVKNGMCYTIETTVHSTNLGVYAPEQGIKQFDQTAINNALSKIVYSFRFLK